MKYETRRTVCDLFKATCTGNVSRNNKDIRLTLSERIQCAISLLNTSLYTTSLSDLPADNMTYTEARETITKPEESNMSISESLMESLNEAKGERRITSGIYACAKLLEAAPESVMLCLVPVDDGSNDVTNVLLHTLVEAFCWENHIRMLKVDSSEKLGMAIGDADIVNANASHSARSNETAYSCVLLQYPDKDHSPSDERVMEYYHKLMYSNQFPSPVIEIPI